MKRWLQVGVCALCALWICSVTTGVTEALAKKKKTSKKEANKKKASKKAAKKKPDAREAAQKPSAKPLNKAERLVEEMVKTSGGKEAWLKVRTLQGVGKTRIVTAMGEHTGQLVTYFLKPNYQRVEMRFGRQKLVQMFSPKGGWLQQNGVTRPLPGSMLETAAAESARSDLELRYRKDGIQVKLAGEKKVRGKACWVVVFTDKKKRQTTYYIGKKDHLLHKRSYKGPSPLGLGKTMFSTYHSKFRWVKVPGKGRHKVRIPHEVENFMAGRKVGVILLRKIKLNVAKIKPRLFRPRSPVD